jgi:MFS family permease
MSASTPVTKEVTDAQRTSLWRNYDFLKFWIGETVSLLGTQVTTLAVPLTAIYVFNASDNMVGVLRFLQLAPYIGFALLFGVWADRHRRRQVMLWTNAVRAVLVMLVPVLHWCGALNMPLLLIIACAVGVASVLFDVSWMPYVPTVVKDSRHYVEANTKVGISYSATSVAGPGLAGFLVAALTAPVALIVDAFSYLVSICSLLLIRTQEPRPAPPAERHVMSELRDGLRYVFGRPVLRWLAIIGFWCNFFMITVWTMFLLYGTHQLRLSASTIGLIFGISSVGAVIGSMLSGQVIKRFPTGPAYLVAQTGLLLGPVVIVVAGGPRLVVVCLMTLSFFITYLGLGVVNVILITVRQLDTPQSLMSRMTACFRMLLFGGGALGGLAAGLIAGWVGNRNALIVAAAGSAAVLILIIISPVMRLRELPPLVTDPVPSER